jgi:pyruvate dehydrogenase E1 component beta subunit
MGATVGLVDEFGRDRVIDTPISEAGFTGMAIGAALSGLRPIVEYEIATLPYVAWDQLVNQAVKMRYMSGGQVSIPATFRVVGSGGGGGMAGQHSDHMWPALVNAGMKVVVPSCPADMKGLLKAAIRDDDPVMVFESAKLMSMRGDVPEGDVIVPMGKGIVRREGTDVTIVAIGYLVNEALVAAETLANEKGISCEVIDVRCLLPFDDQLVLDSVGRTNRLVVADDANRTCGFASEVVSIVCEEFGPKLVAPPRRVTRGGYVIPYARELEAVLMPNASSIVSTVEAIVG